MSKKIIVPIILIFFLTSCDYKPIFSSDKSSFKINKITIVKKNKLTNKVRNSLKNYKSKKIVENIYDIEIEAKDAIVIASKDSKGDPKIFTMNISLSLKILKNEKIIRNKNLEKSFSYNNNSNKFNLKKYEKNIQENLINELIEMVILELHSI